MENHPPRDDQLADTGAPFTGTPQTDVDRRVLRAAELAQERRMTHYVVVWDGLIAIVRTKPTQGRYIAVPPSGRAMIVTE